MAEFVGRTNLLTGRVSSVAPAAMELEVGGQRLTLSGGVAGLREGERVRLVVRPEVIDLGPAESGGGLAGEIVSRTFLGGKVEYQVRVGPVTLQVTSYGAGEQGGYVPGQRVGLRFSAGGIQFLPGGA